MAIALVAVQSVENASENKKGITAKMSVKILIGDVMERIKELPDNSIDCCVTSPPYWGLRDYGVDGQIGVEPTPELHIKALVEVFAEVHRVLKPEGTLWLNYGDMYACAPNGRAAKDVVGDNRTYRDKPFSTAICGYKSKDLILMGARLAMALQAEGWYLRNEIIWHKPNPMPQSVSDRLTCCHEKIFFFSKRPRYFFDKESIKEKSDYAQHDSRLGYGRLRYRGKRQGVSGTGQANFAVVYEYRNKRDVWTIPTRGFKEAHFATFPPDLIRPCILAGCPKGGVVLDPFGGAGTTALVAVQSGRNAIIIELNPDYAAISKKRISDDCGLFGAIETSI